MQNHPAVASGPKVSPRNRPIKHAEQDGRRQGETRALVRVIPVAALGNLDPALLGRGVVDVGVRVEAVDGPTKTLEGVDDLVFLVHKILEPFSTHSLNREERAKTTHIVDRNGLGLAVLDVGDAVAKDLLLHIYHQ